MKRVIVLAASVGVLTAACGSSKPASTKPASTPTVTVTATSSTDTLTQTATVPDTSTPEIPSTPGRPQGIGTDIRVTGNVIVGQPADAELIVSAIKVIPIPDSDYVGLLPPSKPPPACCSRSRTPEINRSQMTSAGMSSSSPPVARRAVRICFHQAKALVRRT
jgi:hypothetical protein